MAGEGESEKIFARRNRTSICFHNDLSGGVTC